MKRILFITIGFLAIFFAASFSVAQDAAPVTVLIPAQDFLAQVLDAVKKFGGLPTLGKISSVVLLLVASMKVGPLKTLIWSKLGAAQAWIAPLLGLLAGVLALGTDLTPAGALAYVGAGAGALVLHELLDSLKALPGLGPVYVTVINFIEDVLTPKPKV